MTLHMTGIGFANCVITSFLGGNQINLAAGNILPVSCLAAPRLEDSAAVLIDNELFKWTDVKAADWELGS